MENLRHVAHVPSVQMQPIPDDAIKCINNEQIARDIADPDVRLHRKPIFSKFVMGDNVVYWNGDIISFVGLKKSLVKGGAVIRNNVVYTEKMYYCS